MTRHVAVIDIGKTNAKLVLVDAHDLREVAVITRPNAVIPGPPWPHFDVEGHWAFLLEGLSRFQASHGIDAISITTHGACAALLDEAGALAAPILDYEHEGPDSVAAEYDALRPPFTETGSPRLAGGLNLGAQIYWQFHIDPTLRERTHRIVTYPQFWGARLTGHVATDVTSLGCHTDMWVPNQGDFSSLVDTLQISDKLAPVRKPSDVIGVVLPEIAARTGLRPDTPVLCGIHDSNASLLPYILNRTAPFSVVSTGTWVVAMSVGSTAVALDPALDTLINVTALGDPAPSARFMGGREHDIGTGGPCPDPTPQELANVLSTPIILMPALAPETGPFKGHQASWLGPEPMLQTGTRAAVVALYLAMVTAECLSNIGHQGEIIVEGPFAANQTYLDMLSVVTDADVFCAQGSTGTSTGAAMLYADAAQPLAPPAAQVRVTPERAKKMQDYAAIWRRAVAGKASMA